MTDDCLFCRIARGEIVAHRIHEDELALAFMDAGQANPGHVIVTVKPHLETITDLSPEQAAAAFRAVQRIARAVKAAFAPDGLTILQANGVAGGQSVPHFHVHLLPRHTDDGVTLTWPRANPPADELAQLAAKVQVV